MALKPGRIMQAVSLFGLIVLLVAGCAAPKDDTINGQVFIVTQGGDNVKLGLVTVALFPLKDVQRAVAAKKAEVAEKGTEIQLALDAAETSLLEAEKQYQGAQGAARAASGRRSRAIDAQWAGGHKEWDKWSDEISKARKETDRHMSTAATWAREVDVRSAAVIRLQEQLAGADSGPLYLEGLPDAKARTQTDANGEFTLKVPHKGAFALAAHSQRKVFTLTEEYTWIVSIPDEVRKGSKFLLSNETITTGGSPLSLVHTAK